MSIVFSKRQKRTWNRLGDIYCPAFDDLPAFSKTNSVQRIGRVLDTAPQADVNLLSVLISVLGFVPTPLLKILVHLLDHSDSWPQFIAQWLRLIRFALKGPIVSVYYGNAHGMTYLGTPVHDLIGFNAQCSPDDNSDLISNRLMERS